MTRTSTTLADVARILLRSDSHPDSCVVAYRQNGTWAFTTDDVRARTPRDASVLIDHGHDPGESPWRAAWTPDGVADPTDEQLVNEAVTHHAAPLAQTLDQWCEWAEDELTPIDDEAIRLRLA